MRRRVRVLDRSSVSVVRRTLAALAAVLAVGMAQPARGGNWATPAAGGTISGDPEILLTFDDGPNPKTTGHVLDILAEHRLRAIFFLTGDHFERDNADRPRALVKRMLAEGHVIANHTMTHAQLCAEKEEAAAAEIDRARKLHELEARMPVPLFRAPYGAWCPRLVKLLEDRGIQHVYWDIDPQEWRTGNAKLTEKKVTWALKRLQGRAVLLMHDTKIATVKALPKILEFVEAENAKRRAAGKRTIRFLTPVEYARELIGREAVEEAESLVDEALGALASGLASALP